MTHDRLAALTNGLEGCRVSLALVNGSRIDDCALISAGRGADRLWIYSNGTDTFVPLDQVVDLWEAPAAVSRIRQA